MQLQRLALPRSSARTVFLLLLAACLVAAEFAVAAEFTAEAAPESFVGYRAHDQLSSWEGHAPIARLELTLDDEHLARSAVTVVIDPAKFDSGNLLRDVNARRTVFETRTYPEIVFRSKLVLTDANNLPDGATVDITVIGELLLHGVRRDLQVPVTLERHGEQIVARGALSLRLSDYQIERPRFLTLVAADEVEIFFEVSAELRPVMR